jgi:hypothetical protein
MEKHLFRCHESLAVPLQSGLIEKPTTGFNCLSFSYLWQDIPRPDIEMQTALLPNTL